MFNITLAWSLSCKIQTALTFTKVQVYFDPDPEFQLESCLCVMFASLKKHMQTLTMFFCKKETGSKCMSLREAVEFDIHCPQVSFHLMEHG